MAESHFVSGLKQRRAEHLGHLQQLREEIAHIEAKERELLDTLGHVDALLRTEAPDLRLEQIKPRGSSGEVGHAGGTKELPVTKAVLRLLRTEGMAMTVDEVVERLAPDYPNIERKKLIQNVRMFMSSRKNAGVLTADGSKPLRYAIPALPRAA